MGLFSIFRNIYDLDTLDTRFTVSSNIPYKTAIEDRSDATAASKERAANWNSQPSTSSQSKSRWNTPEFYLYYVVFIVAIPSMFWAAYSASKSTNYCPVCFISLHDH